MDWGMKLTEGEERAGASRVEPTRRCFFLLPGKKESQEKAMPGDNNGIRFALFKKT